MAKNINCTFYYIIRRLCLVVCEGEHTTLLGLLVACPALVVSSLLTLRVLWPLLVLLVLWSRQPGCVSRCLWVVLNKVIGTPTTVAPVVDQTTLLCTMSYSTASSASDRSWLLDLLLL